MLAHVVMLYRLIPPPECPQEHEVNEELMTNADEIERMSIPPPPYADVQLSNEQWRTRTTAVAGDAQLNPPPFDVAGELTFFHSVNSNR